MKKRIGIIGFGNMGSAIAEGLKNTYEVIVYDKDISKIKSLKKIKVASSNIDLVKNVDLVILAVKPQDFKSLLNEIKDYTKDKFVISIAAGIPIEFIKKYLNTEIVRVMPNLPLKVKKGISCICPDSAVKKENLELAKKIFKKFGVVLVIKENLIDAATAISGSGPGFLYYMIKNKSKSEIKKYIKNIFIPIVIETAQKLGFDKKSAQILAKNTAEGSLIYLNKSKLSLSELINKVASKGGTTEAGLCVLSQNRGLDEAILKAYERAKELGRIWKE